MATTEPGRAGPARAPRDGAVVPSAAAAPGRARRAGSVSAARAGSVSSAAVAAVAVLPVFRVVLAALLAVAGAAAAQAYPNARLLADPAWLSGRLGDDTMLVVDMRSAAAHASGHVPGAVSLPVDAIVATVDRVPFELDEDSVVGALRAVGLRSDHTVVIYDDLGMMNAARLFWTLEYLGHEDVRVLDGGWDAWVEHGGPVESGPVATSPSGFEAAPRPGRLVTAEELAGRLGEHGLVIADARSRAEYLGETTFSGRAGRIPGAVHLPWFDALTGGDVVPTTQPGWQADLTDPDVERMRPAAELRAWLEAAGVTPDAEVVTYCQTFWRGAHLYFVLRLMGFEDVRGYDGSWAEWSVTDLPIETGAPR